MGNSETTVPIGDWSIGSLKVYEDEKITNLKEYFLALRADDQVAIKAALVAQEKAVAAALSAAKEAVIKAESASEKRFESVNEFRKTLSDQTNTFLPRPEYDANHKALEDKIQALTDRINLSTGKSSGVSASWSILLGGLGGIATIVGLILAFNN